MPEDMRYSLVSVNNPNGQKKLEVNKVMFDNKTNFNLITIDNFILNNFNYRALPLNSRLYVFDNEAKRVIPVIPSKLDSLEKSSIKGFIDCVQKKEDVRKDQLWRGSFESVLLNDLSSKATFMHSLNDEKNNDYEYCNQGKPAYFYDKASIEILLEFPRLPKNTSKLDNSHFEYNPIDNKFHIKGYMTNIKNLDEYITSMDSSIEKLATWYSDYRNFRNFYLFRNKERNLKNYYDEDVYKDINVINIDFKNNKKINAINLDQLNVFDNSIEEKSLSQSKGESTKPMTNVTEPKDLTAGQLREREQNKKHILSTDNTPGYDPELDLRQPAVDLKYYYDEGSDLTAGQLREREQNKKHILSTDNTPGYDPDLDLSESVINLKNFGLAEDIHANAQTEIDELPQEELDQIYDEAIPTESPREKIVKELMKKADPCDPDEDILVDPDYDNASEEKAVSMRLK